MSYGDHLFVHRVFYEHHAIDVGDSVIQYSKTGPFDGEVRRVSFEEFARGARILVKPHDDARFTRTESVERARARVGERGYRVLSNNCEHLVEEAITGKARSPQVLRALVTTAGVFAGVALLAVVLRARKSA